VTEQILIRNLPDGTKAALKDRARGNNRSLEAEARAILHESLARPSTSIVDLLSHEGSESIEFEPERLGLRARDVEL
jgi:plasmid stability protein